MKRLQIRKILTIAMFVLFPIIYYYFSPYLTIMGACSRNCHRKLTSICSTVCVLSIRWKSFLRMDLPCRCNARLLSHGKKKRLQERKEEPNQICHLGPLAEKLKRLQLGHALHRRARPGRHHGGLAAVKTVKGKPQAIVAKTVKGKGVSFMENNIAWHGKAPNKEESEKALKEILGG